MIYLQKSRQSRKKPLWVTLATAFFVILLLWTAQRFAGGFVGRLAMNIGGPFASAYLSFENKIKFTTAFLHSRTSLVNENKKLRADIENNQAKLLRFETLQREHDELLTEFNRSPFAGKVVLGNVLSKPPQSPYDVLVVDVGSGHGVVAGNQVYGVGGLPLGRVQETTKTSAKIVMFSSVGEETQVVGGRTSSAFTLVGTGGGNLETQVSQDTDIVIGDTVVLPQFGGNIVASVVAVDTSVASSFKRILFRVPVNVFDIRWVEILKNE